MVAFIQNRNFIKNKILKFFNSTKMGYVFAGLNMNILFKKSPENAPFMDDASKARGISKC